MEMPTLRDLFYGMNGEETSSPELEDEMRAVLGYLEHMTEKRKLKKSVAKNIACSAEDISRTAKCAGFSLGFSVAVRLFVLRD